MSDYVEAHVLLIPAECGGRQAAIAPRAGTYRPFVKSAAGATLRVRFIEGPPQIAPGQDGRVVAEVESGSGDEAMLAANCELEVVEDERVVGILTVARWYRSAVTV